MRARGAACFAGVGVSTASPRDFATRARRAADGVVVATAVSAFSVTATVRCAVRCRMRNARPIGAGRMRFCDGPWFA